MVLSIRHCSSLALFSVSCPQRRRVASNSTIVLVSRSEPQILGFACSVRASKTLTVTALYLLCIVFYVFYVVMHERTTQTPDRSGTSPSSASTSGRYRSCSSWEWLFSRFIPHVSDVAELVFLGLSRNRLISIPTAPFDITGTLI